MKINLNDLNPEQQRAASAIDGPVLILAGAGSGKTRTVTYRIAHMIVNLGIPAESILAVSFTNKAAGEMKERVTHLIGSRKKKGLTLCTFHSLALRILKEDIDSLGRNKNFTIYDSGDQLSIIREALKHFKAAKGTYDIKTILSKIAFLKNQGLEASQFSQSSHFDESSDYDQATEFCYRFYQNKLTFYNAVDFDDILFLAVKILNEFPHLAQKYSKRFHYIMIDEYQDTNTLQLNLIKSLTSTHHNICVVGDDDQSIYAFRGADISNILNFEKVFPKTKIIKLEQNYRSTPKILNLANTVIAKNNKRKDKTMFSTNEDGMAPEIWKCGNADHEAQVVVDEILRLIGKGHHPGEIAVLYRSNTQVPPIEDQLRLAQIPYHILGGQKFYEKKEIKDLIAYLSVIYNPRDEIALRRILNIPQRGIGNTTLRKYLDESEKEKKSLYSLMKFPSDKIDLPSQKKDLLFHFTQLIEKYQAQFRTKNLAEALRELIDEINYIDFIEKSYDSPKIASRKKDDVQNFILSAERFVDKFKSLATLDNFVERLLLADQTERQLDQQDNSANREITLMTFHSSKGLEYESVFIVGAEEELLPHKNTLKEGSDISEERRLCYVALTRAKAKLIISHCSERKIYGKDIPRHITRFLADIPPHLVNLKDRNTFSHMTEEEVVDYKKNFFNDLMGLLD